MTMPRVPRQKLPPTRDAVGTTRRVQQGVFPLLATNHESVIEDFVPALNKAINVG